MFVREAAEFTTDARVVFFDISPEVCVQRALDRPDRICGARTWNDRNDRKAIAICFVACHRGAGGLLGVDQVPIRSFPSVSLSARLLATLWRFTTDWNGLD